MKILFCIPDFYNGNLALQPWLTIYRVGKELIGHGCDLHILTNRKFTDVFEGINIHWVDSLRGTNSREVQSFFKKIQPDAIVTSVTPLSLVTTGWYRELVHYRAFAFLSYPFYTVRETLKAFPYLSANERWSYGRHLLIPPRLWRHALKRFFLGALCQSARSGDRIDPSGKYGFQVFPIPPGIDSGRWFPPASDSKDVNLCSFLYTGTPSSIRGFGLVLEAFKKMARPDSRLRIMARGGDDNTRHSIQRQLDRLQIQDRVSISTGWASPDDLRRAIWDSDAVLLPFVLVPSELPVTVMEVIACGRPVIVTDINGLPEAGEGCALVVEQADVDSLAAAMQLFYENGTAMIENFRFNERRESMLSWDVIAQRWFEVLRGEVNAN